MKDCWGRSYLRVLGEIAKGPLKETPQKVLEKDVRESVGERRQRERWRKPSEGVLEKAVRGNVGGKRAQDNFPNALSLEINKTGNETRRSEVSQGQGGASSLSVLLMKRHKLRVRTNWP